jgi:hypothetical protein
LLGRRRRVRSVLALPLALACLTGCAAGAVPVAVPSPAPTAAAACQTLHERLPASLDGRQARAVEPSTRFAAAWGQPAVVLRCGIGSPSALRADSQLVSVDGVDWFFEDVTDADGEPAVRFTTTGRVAWVEVTVPGPRTGATAPLVDLANAIAASVPLSAAPTGGPTPS